MCLALFSYFALKKYWKNKKNATENEQSVEVVVNDEKENVEEKAIDEAKSNEGVSDLNIANIEGNNNNNTMSEEAYKHLESPSAKLIMTEAFNGSFEKKATEPIIFKYDDITKPKTPNWKQQEVKSDEQMAKFVLEGSEKQSTTNGMNQTEKTTDRDDDTKQ